MKMAMKSVKQFERRGKAIIGKATAVKTTFGEVILIAANVECLELAFKRMSSSDFDGDVAQNAAIIPARRVQPDGSVSDE
jgi:hypothetical protein